MCIGGWVGCFVHVCLCVWMRVGGVFCTCLCVYKHTHTLHYTHTHTPSTTHPTGVIMASVTHPLHSTTPHSGVIMASVTASCEIMQDFRSGYLTYTSTIAMVIGQVLGALAGTIISPIIYQIYYHAFPIGVVGGPYPAPYADQSRAMVRGGSGGGGECDAG